LPLLLVIEHHLLLPVLVLLHLELLLLLLLLLLMLGLNDQVLELPVLRLIDGGSFGVVGMPDLL
jgi:hypothetical protein